VAGTARPAQGDVQENMKRKEQTKRYSREHEKKRTNKKIFKRT
jgi:hypothetical protein